MLGDSMGTKIDMAQLPRGLLSWLLGTGLQWHEIQGFAFQLWPQMVSWSHFRGQTIRPRARADTSFASRVPLKLTLCVSPHSSASRESEVPGTGCQYWHLDIYKRHSIGWNTTTPPKETCPCLAGNINVIPIKEKEQLWSR